MSKAYQLCGQAMIGAGWADKAVEVLLKGHELAARRGERSRRRPSRSSSAPWAGSRPP